MKSYQEQILPSWGEMSQEEQRLARAAWTNGDLDFMVMEHQEELWSIICAHVGLKTDLPLDPKYTEILSKTSSLKPLILEISRRFGKSSLTLLAEIALCLKNKDHTYYFVAPTEGDAEDIFDDVVPPLLSTCPPDLRPKHKGMTYTFHTGSRIKIGGTFNGAEGLRGRAADGVAVDEAGSIKPLSSVSCLTYVMASILGPQLSTRDGWSMILTTPPANMQHDYFQFSMTAQTDNRFIKKTILDNSAFSVAKREELKAASYDADPSGGAWDREYMCNPRPDANSLIISEEIQKMIREEVTVRPEYFVHLHRYIVIDHGTVDLNAILFGYWDYPNARLIIEHEVTLRNGPTTRVIGTRIKEERKKLWADLPVERAVCDSISPQIRIDLNSEFENEDLIFLAPMKTILLSDNGAREGMVNQIITAIGSGQVVIDPSCEILLATLRTAQWKINNGKREFGRFNQIGHCDYLATLIYLWRAVLRNVNPLIGKDLDFTKFYTVIPKMQTSASNFFNAINRSQSPSIFKKRIF